ncbi:MAG: VOC family protein [Halobacteriaceae archaeon]
MPPLSADAHVGRVRLRVADAEGLASFYRDVVGLNVLDSGPVTTLGAGEAPLLELRGDPDVPERPSDATGLFHLAIRVPSRTALGAALARIDRQWRLSGASDHGVSEALYLQDPEGNGVEIYRDRPREAWPTADGQVAMYTEPLDTERLLAAADSGGVVPEGTDVGHVHLDVSDVDAARRFYADELGLRVRQEFDDEAVFLAAGDYHHHVGANTWRGRTAAPAGRGLEWFEVVVPEADIESVREGFRFTRETDAGFAVRDPDGIEVRVRPEDAVL